MSAQANIVAFDGASTPVSHTFVPLSSTKSETTLNASYREGLTTVPAYAQATVDLVERQLPSGVYQTDAIVKVPVMEAVSGQNAAGYTAAPKVAYVNTVKLTGFFHERSTIAERRLVRQLALNVFGSISTSVTPVTTGPVPELVDQFVFPS